MKLKSSRVGMGIALGVVIGTIHANRVRDCAGSGNRYRHLRRSRFWGRMARDRNRDWRDDWNRDVANESRFFVP